MMNSREETEDMLQEAFTQAFVKLDSYRYESSFGAWLKRTDAMEKLPKGGRMVFSLYLLEGYDHGEIAQILGITESTSKSQFMRAKRRVVEILKEQNSRR